VPTKPACIRTNCTARPTDHNRLYCFQCQCFVGAVKTASLETRKAAAVIDEHAYHVDEAALVAEIVREVEARGGTVILIGQHIASGAGNTEGAPDLIIAPQTGVNRWIAFETKTLTGRTRERQAEFIAAGVITLARSVQVVLQKCWPS
jgi:hypothetical protein